MADISEAERIEEKSLPELTNFLNKTRCEIGAALAGVDLQKLSLADIKKLELPEDCVEAGAPPGGNGGHKKGHHRR